MKKSKINIKDRSKLCKCRAKYVKLTRNCNRALSFLQNQEYIFQSELDIHKAELDSTFKICERKFKFLSWILYTTVIIIAAKTFFVRDYYKEFTPNNLENLFNTINFIIIVSFFLYYSTFIMKLCHSFYLINVYSLIKFIKFKSYFLPFSVSDENTQILMKYLSKLHWAIYPMYFYCIMALCLLLKK